MDRYLPVLEKIKAEYSRILGGNLTGIYVHGSIAFRCFNWDTSDIDFIAVTDKKIDAPGKLALLNSLVSIQAFCPPKGVEMSVVLREHCERFVYPTPYELHYSNAWRQRFAENPLLLCDDSEKTDPDLAAHFTVIKQAGIVLCGLPVEKVFGDVAREYFIDSIKKDIADAENEITENPVYVILNLCRFLAYLREGLILSKKQGGEWGLSNLCGNCSGIIQTALACYSGTEPMKLSRQQGSAFCDDLLSKIRALSG